MSNPKVSVILPVYNVEKNLDECLTSIQNQTLQDIEIICINDGSTDNSLDILKKYEETDERFIIIQQENQGLGATRNNGLKVATGEYVIFLDSDDFFSEELLEKTYTRGCETNADIVLFGGDKYNCQTNEYVEAPHFFRKDYTDDLDVFSRTDIPDKIMQVSNTTVWTKLFLRKFIVDEHLQFPTYPVAEDVEFALLSLCIAERISYVDEKLVHYRVGLTTNQSSKSRKYPTFFLKARESLYDELVRRNLFEEVEKSYVNAVIAGCEYNLDTSEDIDEKLSIYKEIMSPAFQNTGVLNHPIEYYDSPQGYYKTNGAKYALKWHEKFAQEKVDNQFRVVRENDLTESPKVSVIIPVYNVESYLEACLKSVANQSLKEIEIICVDDGSTDNSRDILIKYADMDERFNVYTELNSGQSAARNEGMKLAKGKYIYFMDSDDILEENALEAMCNRMDADELDVVYCDASCFSDEPLLEERVEHYRKYYLRTHEYNGIYGGQDLMREMVDNHEYLVSPCLQMVRRTHLVNNGLQFCKGIVYEDNLFNYCCMLSAERTGYIGEKLFIRRLRHNSTMTVDKTFAHAYGYFYCYIQMNDFFNKCDLKEENKKAAIELLQKVLNNARTDYFALPEDEKQAVWGLPAYERTLFELYISDMDKVQADVKKIKEKLQQTYAEKSEINRKLQQTYAEKSEINRKLQQTYAEKSEINRKLQQTYAEKAERGLKIKELERQIKHLKENKK